SRATAFRRFVSREAAYAVNGPEPAGAASTIGPVKLPMTTFPTSESLGNGSGPPGAPGGKYFTKSAARNEYIVPPSYWRSAFAFVTTIHVAEGSIATPVGKKKRAASGFAGSGPNGGGSKVGGAE